MIFSRLISQDQGRSRIHVAQVNPAVPEAKANARLIAAAPELLSTLEAIEWIDDGDPMGKYCAACYNYEHAGHQQDCFLAAAIAKAGDRP